MKERLRQWLNQLLKEAKDKWVMWLVFIPIIIAEDRFTGWANAAIDSNSATVMQLIRNSFVWMQEHTFGFAGFAFVIVILGLIVHAYFDTRPAKAPVVSDAPPPSNPIPVQLPKNSNPRLIATITGKELAKFFIGHTGMQAGELVKPYIGKWMKVSGAFGDITIERWMGESRAHVAFARKSGFIDLDPYVSMYFESMWIEKLSILKINDDITVLGQIGVVSASSIILYECELEAS